jgi:hypothetical protein
MKINGIEYIVGQDRNEDAVVAHLYQGTYFDTGLPMCVRGWNRSDGEGYSIFRGDINAVNGVCKICKRRATEGKPGVPSRKRKTKWL